VKLNRHGAHFVSLKNKERPTMLTEQLISIDIPTLLPTDSGNRALLLMEESHLSQLPMVQNDEYLGLVQEAALLDWDTPERALSSADFANYKPAVPGNSHPFDALKMANEQHLNVVPVLDGGLKYLGSITRNELLRYVSENAGIDTQGGIIVLALEPRQYSLSEIARICENEDVTITASAMKTDAETGTIEVTLKTNSNNLEAVVSSFQRHEYNVTEVFGAASGTEDLRDRYRQLMNYINM
jgi:CBS domain-containing protein